MTYKSLLLAIVILSGCGTVSGIANGVGSVFDGMATDMRGLGDAVRR